MLKSGSIAKKFWFFFSFVYHQLFQLYKKVGKNNENLCFYICKCFGFLDIFLNFMLIKLISKSNIGILPLEPNQEIYSNIPLIYLLKYINYIIKYHL